MQQLFGDTLLSKSGNINTAEAFEGKKAVAIYFSAHWCPPCRQFTPKLAEWYNKDLKSKGLEVVFVSSDKDQASFDSYYAEHPWLALPYDDRAKKDELNKKFKVSGIPSLVIVDAATGNTITTDGRSEVSSDPTGERLPWYPPTKEDAIAALGDSFVDKTGASHTKEARLTKDYIGLYFSAHWCPPCRMFTPELAKMYNEGLKDKMEIVFISSDNDEAAFKEYLAEMPWVALPYEKRSEKAMLSKFFEVEGIPTFVVLDKDFNTITTDGRSKVSKDPKGETLPDGWLPQPCNDINDDPSACNDSTCIIALAKEGAEEGVAAVAAEYYEVANKDVSEMKYRFYTAPEGQIETQIRSLTKTADAGTQLVILDIPDNGGYYVVGSDCSADAVRQAIQDYEAKKLERKQLS